MSTSRRDYVADRLEQAAAAGLSEAIFVQPSFAPKHITASWRSAEAQEWQHKIERRIEDKAQAGDVDALFALGKVYDSFWAIRDPSKARTYLIQFVQQAPNNHPNTGAANSIIARLSNEIKG